MGVVVMTYILPTIGIVLAIGIIALAIKVAKGG